MGDHITQDQGEKIIELLERIESVLERFYSLINKQLSRRS